MSIIDIYQYWLTGCQLVVFWLRLTEMELIGWGMYLFWGRLVFRRRLMFFSGLLSFRSMICWGVYHRGLFLGRMLKLERIVLMLWLIGIWWGMLAWNLRRIGFRRLRRRERDRWFSMGIFQGHRLIGEPRCSDFLVEKVSGSRVWGYRLWVQLGRRLSMGHLRDSSVNIRWMTLDNLLCHHNRLHSFTTRVLLHWSPGRQRAHYTVTLHTILILQDLLQVR